MDYGVFASLVTEDQVAKVVRGFEAAIMASFATDQARLPVVSTRELRITHAEMKRRTEMCMRMFKELRGDLKWGVDRILDRLPAFLRCELDGIPWKPDDRTIWTPEGDTR
ncbi:MAG: hypothetical protein EPO42_14375 [Gallionellaceae bacterium]|nr:MAG: hypothetical protein EPO42_14375 [Gallionellaceae bacterium]